MKKIRWSIIGAGGIADRRAIPALLEDPQNEIVAVMDRVSCVAEAIAKKYCVENWFDNEEDMLSSIECDAVYIATPVFCHYDQAMLALKYNRHVFIEKPIAMNKKESEKLISAFKRANKQLTIGYMMSYHNLHQKAYQIVKDGGIGKLVSARFQFSCWYPDIPGAWRQNKALSGGGCIMDLAVHCMELFTRVTGQKIEEVKAFYATQTFNYEVEDSAVITFVASGGALCHIDVNFNIPDNAATSKMELYGTDGSIIAEGTLGQEERGKLKYIYSPQGSYDAAQARVSSKPKIYYGRGKNIYTKQFNFFNNLISRGKTCYDNADLALEIQAICDNIYS